MQKKMVGLMVGILFLTVLCSMGLAADDTAADTSGTVVSDAAANAADAVPADTTAAVDTASANTANMDTASTDVADAGMTATETVDAAAADANAVETAVPSPAPESTVAADTSTADTGTANVDEAPEPSPAAENAAVADTSAADTGTANALAAAINAADTAAAAPVAASVPAGSVQNVPIQAESGIQYVTLSKPGKDVFVKNRSGEWVPAADGMVILPGDEVRTAPDSSVEVILDGGKVGRIEVKGGSSFTITKADSDPVTGSKKTLINLAVGKILVQAEALQGNSQFEVRTPSAIAGVRGTLFEVEVEGKLEPRS